MCWLDVGEGEGCGINMAARRWASGVGHGWFWGLCRCSGLSLFVVVLENENVGRSSLVVIVRRSFGQQQTSGTSKPSLVPDGERSHAAQ